MQGVCSGKSTALQIRRILTPALIILVTLVKSFSLSMLVFLSMFLKALWEEIVIIACLTVLRVVLTKNRKHDYFYILLVFIQVYRLVVHLILSSHNNVQLLHDLYIWRAGTSSEPCVGIYPSI